VQNYKILNHTGIKISTNNPGEHIEEQKAGPKKEEKKKRKTPDFFAGAFFVVTVE
jgi:hypothetical protein